MVWSLQVIHGMLQLQSHCGAFFVLLHVLHLKVAQPFGLQILCGVASRLWLHVLHVMCTLVGVLVVGS